MLAEILQLLHEISSLSEMFYKKGILKTFSKFRGKNKKQSSRCSVNKVFPKTHSKNLSRSPFLLKLTAWRRATLLERDCSTGTSVFCTFCKIFRRTFLYNNPWQSLLIWHCFFSFWRSMRCNFFWWSNATFEKRN